jgi:hypothetical protein
MPGEAALEHRPDLVAEHDAQSLVGRIKESAEDGMDCLSAVAQEAFESRLLGLAAVVGDDSATLQRTEDLLQSARRWQSALWEAAATLHASGSPDRLLERYWSLTRGQGTRRPSEESEASARDRLEQMRDTLLDGWIAGTFLLDPDVLEVIDGLIQQSAAANTELARAAEVDAIQASLIAEYLLESESWCTAASARAYDLITLSRIGRPSGKLGAQLGRVARLYIDGHDVAVCVFARAALEAALTQVCPDAVVIADLGIAPDDLSLARRIQHARQKGRLRDRDVTAAHRIRERANHVLHNRAGSAAEQLDARSAIADLFNLLGFLDSR